MNFKEHTIVEKWKEVSTEEIKALLDYAKNLKSVKKESFVFYIGLIFFIIPSLIFPFVIGFNKDSMFIITVSFISYYFFWRFYLRAKSFNQNDIKEFELQIDEFETVLKYRK